MSLCLDVRIPTHVSIIEGLFAYKYVVYLCTRLSLLIFIPSNCILNYLKVLLYWPRDNVILYNTILTSNLLIVRARYWGNPSGITKEGAPARNIMKSDCHWNFLFCRNNALNLLLISAIQRCTSQWCVRAHTQNV